MNAGTRCVRIGKANGQWAAEELWTSRNLKSDFTDLVTYQGYAYGNDAGIWTCIDLKAGVRKWKGGRYGKGQAVSGCTELPDRATPAAETAVTLKWIAAELHMGAWTYVANRLQRVNGTCDPKT